MLRDRFSLCLMKITSDELEALTKEIVDGYEIKSYDDAFITEEEFVYDSLRNEPLYDIIKVSSQSSADVLDDCDDDNDNASDTALLRPTHDDPDQCITT